jgi:signal transduction histidine kinase
VVTLLFGAWGITAEWVRYAWPDLAQWGPDLVVGFSWLGFALVVIWGTAASRAGMLMLAFSGAWFIGNFAALDSGVLAGLAAQGTYLHRGVLVHLLLTFPSGRFDGRRLNVLVLASYGVSLAPSLARSTPITIVLACLLAGVAGWRVRESFGQSRRPRVVAFATAILVSTSLVVFAAARQTVSASDDDVLLLAYQFVLEVVGAILTTAAVRLRHSSAGVTDIVVDLADGPPSVMAQALAHALADPSLNIGYWAPERGVFLDAAGSEFSGDAAPGRVVSIVRSREGPLLALDHDAATMLSVDVTGSLEQAASLMVANARLHAELRDRARELEAARRRLVDTEAVERRRLEERLRAGAGHRLEGLRRTLAMAEQVSGPAVATELAAAMQLLDRGVADLARLSQGLYPSTLTADGLPAALRELADSAPVTVDVVMGGEVPEHLQELVYFGCAEALANVVKHARAASARITVVPRDGLLRVEVTDDGVGLLPREPNSGSGLSGLSDRVAAYGGTVEVSGFPSGGTRVAVQVSLDDRSRPQSRAVVITRPSPNGGP